LKAKLGKNIVSYEFNRSGVVLVLRLSETVKTNDARRETRRAPRDLLSIVGEHRTPATTGIRLRLLQYVVYY